MEAVRIIGPGRAGTSLGQALAATGIAVDFLGRGDDFSSAAHDVDLCVIATPDGVIAEVAQAIDPGRAVVAHLAGSRGLDVLAPHERIGAMHPLASLPDAATGQQRLTDSGWFAVAGDPLIVEVVERLGGRYFEVADEHRGAYHAAAAIASNHTVALLGQVERVAAQVGVPFEAFLPLITGSVDNVATKGAAAALTGPVARGDESTLDLHRASLDPSELELYEALVVAARRLIS